MAGVIAFPAVPAGPDVVVSASTYLVYRQCPEQAAGRLRGEYGPDTARSFVGGLSHRIFARHLRDGPIEAGAVQQACREEIGAGMNPKLASLGLRPSALAGLIREVGDLYDRFKAQAFSGFVAAEVALEAQPAPGVTLRGAVDAVFDDDGTSCLVDWKTGRVPEAAVHQLGFYALLWALERGELPGRVEAVSVQTGERREAAPTLPEVAATADAVAGMVTALREAWSAGRDALRVGGPWCRYCPQVDECAEGQAAALVMASA